MKCKSCNAENPEDAVYCKECGTALNDEQIKQIEQKTMVLDAGTRVVGNTLSFSPGEFFGERYQIIEEIGQGGMGTVFKAMDKELDIVVALKMIKPQLSSKPDIVSRFKRELLLAREILHEHVIRIHDLGEVNGIKYISMNYIEGNSLDEILKSTGKLTVEKSIDITKQVCQALIAAHGKGIVHRDLKPQNIMINKQGKAFVLDFGIARSLDTGEVDAGATQEGIVLGTPHFMSPEQIQGQKVDAATDIYALGVIMYEMVTGRLPFNAKNPAALLHMHLSDKPEPPCKLNPQCPPKLEKIILKCMEKKKKARYGAVEEMVQDLEQDKTVQIPPLKRKEKSEDGRGGFLKYAVRLLILLFIIYAALSVSSLITDNKYSVEIEKLKSECKAHYKAYFPIQKDWLPEEWETKDANAWEIYGELFPPRPDESPAADVIHQRLADAVKYSILDIHDASGEMRKLGLSQVRKYADTVIKTAQADFLEERYETGVDKLFHLMVFCIDLFTASTGIEEHRAALTCFDMACRELIPLLLSRELDMNSLLPYERDGLAAFGEIDPRIAPKVVGDTPPVREETKEAVAGRLQAAATLIEEALKRFIPYSVFYSEYLGLGGKGDDIYTAMGIKQTDYHIYKKVFYWKHWFSINRYFYKEGITVYQGLLDTIEKSRDIFDQNNNIDNHFNEHVKENNSLVVDGPRLMADLVVSRMLGKVAAILSAVNQYGMDSKEFLELKGTKLFINERLGDTFKISREGRDFSIVLDAAVTLPLEKLPYKDGHKKLLKSLSDFH